MENETTRRIRADLGKRIKGIKGDPETNDVVEDIGSRVHVSMRREALRDYLTITVPDNWVVDTDEVLSRYKRPPPSLKGWKFYMNYGDGTVWEFYRPRPSQIHRAVRE